MISSYLVALFFDGTCCVKKLILTSFSGPYTQCFSATLRFTCGSAALRSGSRYGGTAGRRGRSRSSCGGITSVSRPEQDRAMASAILRLGIPAVRWCAGMVGGLVPWVQAQRQSCNCCGTLPIFGGSLPTSSVLLPGQPQQPQRLPRPLPLLPSPRPLSCGSPFVGPALEVTSMDRTARKELFFGDVFQMCLPNGMCTHGRVIWHSR